MGTVPEFRAAANRDSPHFQRADVLIVGGGHAGAHAAIALRNEKYAGSIAIVTDESELPYERPPLSKDYLAGVKPFERLLFRPSSFWTERGISIHTDRRVTRVDAAAKSVTTVDGAQFQFDVLIWAAGGRARRLVAPGAELAGVHSVRTRADSDAILAQLPSVQSIVIIGGGYIGLEAASVLRKLGNAVTILEMQPRILARVAAPEISKFYEKQHRAHGVDVRTGVAVDRLEGDGRVSGVRLASGEVLAAQLVIVGIGIVPNVEPLIDAGAIGTNGVHVDDFARTSLTDVYAIGDCAAHCNAFAGGERVRVESVQNANEQASAAAKTIAGQPTRYCSVPWFWSDQYDLKLQIAGLSIGYDTTVLRGDPSTRSFSLAYLQRGRLIAFDCVNATRDYVQARKLIVEGAMPNLEALVDSRIALKDVPTRKSATG